MPRWLIDTDADAHVRYKASKTCTWSDSEYRYTETKHYPAMRAGSVSFENVPDNDYMPAQPFTVDEESDPTSNATRGYFKVTIRSGGADSPWSVQLRQKAMGNGCFGNSI